MIPRLVPEIEGGYPERDGEEEGGEGLVLENSRSWIMYSSVKCIILLTPLAQCERGNV